MMRAQLNHYSLLFIYLAAMTLSVMLSYFAINKSVMLNPDGICYLLSAEQLLHAGLKSAMQLCGQASWPFYSVLLAMLGVVSPFSLEQSAHLLNTLFDAITALFFIMIIHLFTTKPRILLLSVFTILCAHSFNSVRDDIIRDHGYWMCYLGSLYFLLRYVRCEKLVFAWAYSISILMASLFRIEGIVFFMLLPLTMLVLPGKRHDRVRRFFVLYCPHMLLALTILCASFFLSDRLHTYSGRLPLVLDKIQHSITLIITYFQSAKNNLLQYVLPLEAGRDATLVLSLLLIIWYCLLAITQLSWVYAGVLFYALIKRINITNYRDTVVLGGYVMINLLITISFFAMHLFLSKRYLMAQSLVLMLFIPFTLNYLLDKIKLRYQKGIVFGLFGWMVLTNSHLISTREDPHQYIVDAGHWVKTYVGATLSFYTNDAMLMYYTERTRSNYFILMNQYAQLANLLTPNLQAFNYVAINTRLPGSDKLLSLMASEHAIIARRFENHRHDQIVIYHLQLKKDELS